MSKDDSVKHEGKWTRDDLPSVIKWKSYAGMYLSRLRELEEYVDATLDHLNAHYPKSQPYDQGGVRGVDSLLCRAERERDAAVARADNLDKQLAKVMSDYQDVEDERDEWKARAEAAEARTAPAVTDEQRDAVADHLWGEMVGSAKSVVRDVVRDAFTATGIEVADVDPVETKARVEADRRYSGDPNHAFIEGALWAHRHAIGQESSRDE